MSRALIDWSAITCSLFLSWPAYNKHVLSHCCPALAVPCLLMFVIICTDATTGGTDDFARGAANVKYSYCLELRGSSFIVPSSEILKSFNEVWNGVVAMFDAISIRR